MYGRSAFVCCLFVFRSSFIHCSFIHRFFIYRSFIYCLLIYHHSFIIVHLSSFIHRMFIFHSHLLTFICSFIVCLFVRSLVFVCSSFGRQPVLHCTIMHIFPSNITLPLSSSLVLVSSYLVVALSSSHVQVLFVLSLSSSLSIVLVFLID